MKKKKDLEELLSFRIGRQAPKKKKRTRRRRIRRRIGGR